MHGQTATDTETHRHMDRCLWTHTDSEGYRHSLDGHTVTGHSWRWIQTQIPMDTPTHMSTDRGRYGQAGLERQADTLTQSGTETDKHGWNRHTKTPGHR